MPPDQPVKEDSGGDRNIGFDPLAGEGVIVVNNPMHPKGDAEKLPALAPVRPTHGGHAPNFDDFDEPNPKADRLQKKEPTPRRFGSLADLFIGGGIGCGITCALFYWAGRRSNGIDPSEREPLINQR
jgi:hypothetical protein